MARRLMLMWVLGAALVAQLPARFAVAQVGGQAPAGASSSGGGAASIFAGSMISTRGLLGANSIDKSADPTWNPNVGMALLLAPRVALGDRLSLSALLTVSREFTHEDWTTQSGETTLSDTFVTLGASIWSSKELGLSLSGAAQLRLPTSKPSQQNTMILAGLAGVGLSWSGQFTPMGWSQSVNVALIGRTGPFVHRYTTGSTDTPWVDGCAELVGGCSQFSHDGVRNPAWRHQGIAALTWGPHPRLSLSLQGGVFYDLLTPQPKVTSRAGFEVGSSKLDPDARAIVFTAAYLNFVVTPAVSIAAGVETAHEQLAPDSTYRQPFLNRFSTYLIAFRLFPDALVAGLRSPSKG